MSTPVIQTTKPAVLVLVFLVVLPFTSSLRAENSKDTLTYKDGTISSCTIHETNAWALTLADKGIVPIKSLSEIKTYSSIIAERLRSFYPQINETRLDSLFVFSVRTLRLLPYMPSYAVKRYTFLLQTMTARKEQLEFQMNATPNGLDNFTGQVSVSSGTGVTSRDGNLHQVSLGAGYNHFLERTDFSIVTSLGYKSFTSMVPTISRVVTFLSLYVRHRLWDDGLVVSAGTRYHISNLAVHGETTRLSFNIGVGIIFEREMR